MLYLLMFGAIPVLMSFSYASIVPMTLLASVIAAHNHNHGNIPHTYPIILFFSGIAFNINMHGTAGLEDALLGAATVLAPVLILSVVINIAIGGYKLIIGGGDVKLTACVGAWLGYSYVYSDMFVQDIIIAACMVLVMWIPFYIAHRRTNHPLNGIASVSITIFILITSVLGIYHSGVLIH